MASHFYALPIKKIIRETKDCVAITFAIPNNVKNNFQFIQGQNITLKAIINNQEVRRSYSICSAPHENELTIAIKKVPEGIFSTYANDLLKVGDVIEVMPPSGNFNTVLLKDNCKKYIAIAAGSGITPILSLIKSTLFVEPNSTFTLVYGNQYKNTIIFFEAIEALKNKYVNRFKLIHILSKEKTEATINFGRVDNTKLKQLEQLIDFKNNDEFFICGPEEMIFTSRDFLIEKGIEKKHIHFELFATSTPKKIFVPTNKQTDNAPKSNIQITLDGRSLAFKLGFNNENILDAALALGADLPYACKGGVCCTCKAKLILGEVKMDVNYALEEDEVANGFILTCQSHPISENVVIDFDQK
jgi:ring-1,2-phenylacetyl-CoA epoxidase subunit PaaE